MDRLGRMSGGICSSMLEPSVVDRERLLTFAVVTSSLDRTIADYAGQVRWLSTWKIVVAFSLDIDPGHSPRIC